jgi:hypothetical protein
MTMDYEKFEAQRKYCAAVSIGMALKKEGLITGTEFKTIKHKFEKMYEPLIKTIGDEPAPLNLNGKAAGS